MEARREVLTAYLEPLLQKQELHTNNNTQTQKDATPTETTWITWEDLHSSKEAADQALQKAQSVLQKSDNPTLEQVTSELEMLHKSQLKAYLSTAETALQEWVVDQLPPLDEALVVKAAASSGGTASWKVYGQACLKHLHLPHIKDKRPNYKIGPTFWKQLVQEVVSKHARKTFQHALIQQKKKQMILKREQASANLPEEPEEGEEDEDGAVEEDGEEQDGAAEDSTEMEEGEEESDQEDGEEEEDGVAEDATMEDGEEDDDEDGAVDEEGEEEAKDETLNIAPIPKKKAKAKAPPKKAAAKGKKVTKPGARKGLGRGRKTNNNNKAQQQAAGGATRTKAGRGRGRGGGALSSLK